MADFFSQFQVHPPNDGFQPGPAGGSWGSGVLPPGGYGGGASYDGPPGDRGGPYQNDFTPRNPDGSLVTGPLVGPDPRVTTQPQPYQQGPGGLIGSLPDWMQNKAPGIDRGGEILTDEQRQQRDQQLNDMFNKMGFKPQPGPYGQSWEPFGAGPGMWDGRSPYKPSPMPPGWNPGPHDMTVLPSGQQFPDFKMDMSPDKSGWQQPGGTLSGGIGNQGGIFAPPAIAMGPNGGFINPGTGAPYQGGAMQPMNPAQQSGALGSPMVQMTGPDGSQQFVDPQHVPHYQGLGAQVTGQQLAGMSGSSYGGGNG